MTFANDFFLRNDNPKDRYIVIPKVILSFIFAAVVLLCLKIQKLNYKTK
jgi:hypothetical protein